MEADNLIALLDELATIEAIAQTIESPLNKVLISLKLDELKSVLESLLSIEKE